MMLGSRDVPVQLCPLCNEPQDLIVNGHIPAEDPKKLQVVKDKGYSFCNCRNIFYTDWSNIRQGVYDEAYTEKYKGSNIDRAIKQYWESYSDQIIRNTPVHGKVLEVGCINPILLDQFANTGFQTYALDIIEHDFKGHQNLAYDFENFDSPVKFDVVWASHVFEHFKDPVKAVETANNILNKGGLLFVSMPDPYFIDWRSPYSWGHWHLFEHHILWDMDSFAKVLKEKGFEIVFAKHNVGLGFICWSDFHILARKI